MRCPVIVGRRQETKLLAEMVDAAAAGRGSCVFVQGEPGIGKSRLTAAAAERAASAGLVVLRGRAVPSDRPVGLRPLSEAVLGALRRHGVPDDPGLEPFRHALGKLAPQYAHAEPGESPSLIVVAEALMRLVGSLAAGAGAVLVLEDLHWSDPETLAVAEYLADNVADEPFALILTSRAQKCPATDLGAAHQPRGAAHTITLDRLGGDDSGAMVRACLAAQDLPPEIESVVLARAEGLPLLVEDLLTGLQAGGGLRREEDGTWVVDPGARPDVPATFAESVARRLAGLDGPARRVLAAAAVVGPRFDWRLLAPVTGLAEAEVLDALREAVDRDLVAGESHGFRFRHALTRDAVLAGLLPPERSRLAVSAAQAVLAAAGPDGATGEAQAAELFEDAGHLHEAAVWWNAAGRRSLQAGALLSARSMLRRAAQLAGTDRLLELDAREALAEVLALAGETELALAEGAALVAVLSPEAEPDRLARARLRLARAAIAAGRWQEATACLDAAEAAEPAAVDAMRAQVALGGQRPQAAARLARRALDKAEANDQFEVTCQALEVLGQVARLTDLAAAERCFLRAYATAERYGHELWRVRALNELATIDVVDARDEDRLAAVRRAALATGALATVANVDCRLTAMRVEHGDLEGALASATASVERSRRLRLPLLPKALMHLATVHGLGGRNELMEQLVEQARRAAPDDRELAAGLFQPRYFVALWKADDAQVLAMLDSAMPAYGRYPALAAPFKGMWALLKTADGDGADARETVRKGAQLTTRYNWVLLRYADAVAAGRSGRGGAAEELFTAAQREYPAERGWLAQHAVRITATAALADGWGEPEQWLRQGSGWFDRNGQPEAAAACRRALRTQGRPVPRAAAKAADIPAPLRGMGVTPREMEVLRLLWEGLSTGDIAARLFLSPRTVESHVAHLMQRTGVHTRSRLVARTRPGSEG